MVVIKWIAQYTHLTRSGVNTTLEDQHNTSAILNISGSTQVYFSFHVLCIKWRKVPRGPSTDFWLDLWISVNSIVNINTAKSLQKFFSSCLIPEPNLLTFCWKNCKIIWLWWKPRKLALKIRGKWIDNWGIVTFVATPLRGRSSYFSH